MSIILKGIDLPKDDIVIHYANIYGEMETVYVDKSDIIQIPKDHGRLIDAEAIKNVFDKGDTFTAFHFIEAMDNAPTILEAEE